MQLDMAFQSLTSRQPFQSHANQEEGQLSAPTPTPTNLPSPPPSCPPQPHSFQQQPQPCRSEGREILSTDNPYCSCLHLKTDRDPFRTKPHSHSWGLSSTWPSPQSCLQSASPSLAGIHPKCLTTWLPQQQSVKLLSGQPPELPSTDPHPAPWL